MLALTILSILILILFLIIIVEYRNEKKYQAKRRKQTENKSNHRKELKVKNVEPEPKPEPIPEIPKKSKQLPQANYPLFSHVRLVDMGLSDNEAKEFVGELIVQLEVEIPLIKAALQDEDFHRMERLTHGIKGSATNLGTGGVSDLLDAYNTYLKTGTDIDIIKGYFEHLMHYTAELKKQYN